ncbi:MAG: double-strand break repair helicase AddA [Rhodospirillaceae bacterium]|nr:double-strand break repair helicase AddA [Rhodospirillaceae bacterium]
MTARAMDPTAQATRDQNRAADPAVSAWVSASAGSGKTQVLRDRVLRLLLEGAAPERILCLTFTKAGAAEMSNRIATTLAEWAAMPDDALKRDLQRLVGGGRIATLKETARGLFARVLDAPGGMRIETIHAFCQSLLRRFPLEAQVAPHFHLIEERDAAALLAAAREAQLEAARSGQADDLRNALDHLVERSGEVGIDRIVGALLHDRARLSALQNRMRDATAYRRALAALLGIDPSDDRRKALLKACRDDAFDVAGLRAAADVLARGGKTDAARATTLAAFLAASVDDRLESFEGYLQVYFTAKLEPRAKLAGKDAVKAMPDIERMLEREVARLIRVLDRLRAVDILADSAALMTLGLDLLIRFQKLKAATAALDFDDLILATRQLLQRPGIAPWVLYKLDGGIDHVLIDEGQDTSPVQWDIVKALTEELVAGSGADRRHDGGGGADRPRSVFAVGDYKQSIFSFQGAEPRAFLAAREHFQERLARAPGASDPRTSFLDIPLNVSFRSSPAVLQVVDTVFAGPAGIGVGDGKSAIQHIPARIGAAGLVEVWPLAIPLDGRDPVPWAPPEIDSGPSDPAARLALAIADKIADLVKGGQPLPARGRAIHAGDIMVLVRSRTAFVPALVKALKARGIEVSGIDRLVLMSELAVQDLVAMLDFMLLPEDDLNLAALLKSPLIGLSEEDLFELCIERGDQSLWQRLRDLSPTNPRFAEARRFLADYLERSQRLTPYELLADLLTAGDGRRRLLARLGLQVGEAIEELLNLALGYETNNLPSLQGFRHWLDVSEAEVKRELGEDGGGQVRIMTVHGAKGLQAPVVFIADGQRGKPVSPGLFWLGGDAAELPVWVPRKELDVAATQMARNAAEQRAEEEENRLLYVAMTRAEDCLYVCGWRGRRNSAQVSWHANVAGALADLAAQGVADMRTAEPAAWRDEDGWEGIWRSYACPQADPPGDKVTRTALPIDIAAPFQHWALHPVAPEPDPPRPLIPSRPSADAGADTPLLSPLGRDQGFRFQRGLVIHKLFQLLPDLPLAERRPTARRWLTAINRSSGLAAGDSDLDAIVDEVMAVLEDPAFASLFVPGSRAEVPIVAELAKADGGREILSGQIDRLVVTATHCHIVDFKSNRPPAMQAEHVSVQYLRQLALYRSAIRKIYPSHTVACYLLWSAVPRLMPIPDHLLDSHAS